MRTVLICHHDEALNRELLPRWLASFSELKGILVIKESRHSLQQRLKRELNRVGPFRILDVMAFRIYYRLKVAAVDQRWENQFLDAHISDYPPLHENLPFCEVENPNSELARNFLEKCQPDLILARCKHLLQPSVFEIPPLGTFVLHPGICPEYRNAHGCFWALAHRDLEKVGASLLRIDRGIDTGPIYSFFTYPFDENTESHICIQNRVVFENLTAIRSSLLDIEAGLAEPIDVTGRTSGNWGQPWLSVWMRWKKNARLSAANKL